MPDRQAYANQSCPLIICSVSLMVERRSPKPKAEARNLYGVPIVPRGTRYKRTLLL